MKSQLRKKKKKPPGVQEFHKFDNIIPSKTGKGKQKAKFQGPAGLDKDQVERDCLLYMRLCGDLKVHNKIIISE